MLVPIANVFAALIAGLFLWLVNRKRPHELLKTDIELYKSLPLNWNGRADLKKSIEERLGKLSDKPQTKEIPLSVALLLIIGFAVVRNAFRVALF